METLRPDIIVTDDDGKPTVFVEVKNRVDPSDRSFFLNQLRNYATASSGESARYIIFVEEDGIRIYTEHADQPLLVLPPTVLDDYDFRSGDRSGRRYEAFLSSLTVAWLRDFRNRVFHAVPPGSEKLPKELLEVLHRGDVQE